MLKRSVVIATVGEESLPAVLRDGVVSIVGSTVSQLSTSSVKIKKGVFITLDSFGTNTWVKIGNATSRNWRPLRAVGDTVFLDIVDDLNKIYILGDNAANDGQVSYNAG